MGSTAEKEWFYLTMGHRRGPVTREEFCRKIAKQEVFVDSTQVWKQGMTQWINLGDAKPFAADIKKLKAKASEADARVREASAVKGIDEDIVCRGSSRGLFNLYFYLGWLVPFVLAVVVLTELQVQQFLSPQRMRTSLLLQLLPFLALAVATWQMAASRMQHAGYSKAHGLGVFVPLYNLWVFFICLFAPRNYGRRKKLGAGAFGYMLICGLALFTITAALLPKAGSMSFTPIAFTEAVTDMYKEKTNYSTRFNKNAIKAESAAMRKEQLKKQKEAERLDAARSLRGQ